MAGRGSSPGERRGGRQKGTPNKVTAARAAAIAESGKTPLDFMLSVLRDEDADDKDRMWAAVAAAPYVHPKPRPKAHDADAGRIQVNVVRFTHEQSLAHLEEIDAQARREPDNQRAVREPALPSPAPTPPQPPVPALVVAPVPHENRPVHWAKGNGTSTTQPQRVNGASRPRPGNGAVVRRSDEEIRNISDRRPMPSGYPRTRPVHGV